MVHKNKRVLLIAMLGTILEWADYSFFGYMNVAISKLFFPQIDARTGILATFGIFAAGFFMRPLGALLFGHIGDKRGRKKALSYSLLLMGIATFCISFLPSYNSIGLLAPILLLLCRLTQGLAVGGEFNGAAIFLIEHSRNNHPNLAGSWIGTAVATGMMLGACFATIVSMPGLPVWAWRVPFLLGFATCLIGSYLRYKLLESPQFLETQIKYETVELPIKEALLKHKKPLLITMVLAAYVGIFTYICNIYYVTFLIKQSHTPNNIATTLAAIGELFIVILFPICGYMADKLKRSEPLIISGLLSTAIIVPFVFLLGLSGSFILAALGQVLYAVFNAVSCAPLFKYVFDLFPTSTRYTGNSFAWSISVALFGGTAPFIAEYLVTTQNYLYGPAIYVSLISLIAASTVILNTKLRRTKIIESAYYTKNI